MDGATAAAVTTTAEEHTSHGPAVFHIIELFEGILCNLDMKTLLLAQRVDRHWRTIICTSKPMQQKLFFQPATFDQILSLNAVETRLPITEHEYPGQKQDNQVTPEPNIFNLVYAQPWKLVLYNPLLFDPQVFESPQLLPKIYQKPDSTTIRPSWEKMLLVQPTQHEIELSFEMSTSSGCYACSSACLPGDVLAPDVLKAAEQRVRAIKKRGAVGFRMDLEPGLKIDKYLFGGSVSLWDLEEFMDDEVEEAIPDESDESMLD
ncbi:hypothetical protein CKM354_000374000 [Cercospora kikuchii]|uniref:F-box domain-containing protein n=1 Tax=Cercospora kikuchii TaxID=84275 RepID=A0A9P3CCP5_9PEZI|nr:uncharacterized protein CKM354_000374000 [Cercospora kikuchii]GIZ40403.1 hypothetical protein CKM354_000374000 [Cercospora kikuchii]